MLAGLDADMGKGIHAGGGGGFLLSGCTGWEGLRGEERDNFFRVLSHVC